MRPAFPACKMRSPASSSEKTRPRRGYPRYDPLYLVVIGIAMLVSQLVGTQMKRGVCQIFAAAGGGSKGVGAKGSASFFVHGDSPQVGGKR